MTLYTLHYITLDYTTLHYIHTNSTCIQTSRILNSFQGKMPNRVHYQKAPARYKPGGFFDQPWGRCGATPNFCIQVDFCMNLQPPQVWYQVIFTMLFDMIYSTQMPKVPQVGCRFMWSCCIALLLLLADWMENAGRTARCDDLRLSQLLKFEDHGGIPIFIDQTAEISRIFQNWMIFNN